MASPTGPKQELTPDPAMDVEPDSNGSLVFAALIDDQLQQERDRKVSLEQRSMAVITSSGVLVSLLFGFNAIVSDGGSSDLPVGARVFLAGALVSFVAAAVMSLLANSPRDYVPFSVEKDLGRMVGDDLWRIAADSARRSIAEFRVREIDRWRDNNGAKAAHLQHAVAAECVGIGLLAIAVIVGLV